MHLSTFHFEKKNEYVRELFIVSPYWDYNRETIHTQNVWIRIFVLYRSTCCFHATILYPTQMHKHMFECKHSSPGDNYSLAMIEGHKYKCSVARITGCIAGTRNRATSVLPAMLTFKTTLPLRCFRWTKRCRRWQSVLDWIPAAIGFWGQHPHRSVLRAWLQQIGLSRWLCMQHLTHWQIRSLLPHM